MNSVEQPTRSHGRTCANKWWARSPVVYGVHTWVVWVCVGRCVRIRNCLGRRRREGGRQDNAKDALPLSSSSSSGMCRRHAHMSLTLACTVHTTTNERWTGRGASSVNVSSPLLSAHPRRKLIHPYHAVATHSPYPTPSSHPMRPTGVNMSQRRNNILQSRSERGIIIIFFIWTGGSSAGEGSGMEAGLHQYLQHSTLPFDSIVFAIDFSVLRGAPHLRLFSAASLGTSFNGDRGVEGLRSYVIVIGSRRRN